GGRRGACAARSRERLDRRVRADGARVEGQQRGCERGAASVAGGADRRGDPRGGGLVVVRAPASTANLGPGFDCAAAALDLWNEMHVLPASDGEPLVTVEVVGDGELPTDASHLALRAFALAAPIKGRRFHFVNRIPLERGLGSSAATVAAGITAGLVVAGRD